MNLLLIYFLKVIAIQAILYSIYVLAFHKSGRHTINRFYLILSLVLSFLLPVVTLPNMEEREEFIALERPIWHELAEFTEFSSAETELIPVAKLDESRFILELVLLAMALVSLLLFIKLIYSHIQLLRLKKQSAMAYKNGFTVYHSEIDSPFSYFNAVFIPKSLIDDSSIDTIMKHEFVHVTKRHSFDRLFIEIISAVIWFNPIQYLFRNRLIEIHEFQADEEVIKLKKDPIEYQEILYNQINSRNAVVAANHFKLKTIKTRIKMINKNKKLSKWHYLLILPVLALMTVSFANKENAEFIAPLKNDVSDVFDYVVTPSDNYTPSIFPLKDAVGVKLTASFGKRIHPILKEERMHEGIDLKTYKGNPVLATADGIVTEAGSVHARSWGKLIRISHNGIYETVYAHLSDIKVKSGDKVKRGDVIGNAGTTGKSTGPHLHYEVKELTKGFLNPVDFINDFDFKRNNEFEKRDNIKLGEPNQKLKVVIDAGHGGKDDGIKSSEAFEKEIVLKVANQLAENFKNSNEVEIILTRINDEYITLQDRVKKTENADLFISLHVESHEDENEDVMVAIYNDQNDNAAASQYFADLLSNEFYEINRKFKLGYNNGFYVLKNSKCPAILFNMGYISNSESVTYLNSEEGIQQIAKEISDAIKASK